MESVAKHGYERNIHARGLASKSSHTVSVVVPHLNHVFADVYFGEIVSGIYDQTTDEGYKTLLDMANMDFIRRQEYVNLLKAKRADAMIFISATLFDEYLRVFDNTHYPFVLVNHYFPNSSMNYIAANYQESARLSAQHLLELGHRKIGLISGMNVQTALDFVSAFKKCCFEAGLSESNIVWADGRFSEDGGHDAARKLMSENEDITALMAGNDKMAIGALRYCQTHGHVVPDDVSLMGLDDLPMSSFTTPGLTTVHHQLYHMGRLACKRALEIFRGERMQCQELLPVKLIVRESTAPPRKKS